MPPEPGAAGPGAAVVAPWKPWLCAVAIAALSAVLGFTTLTRDHDWGDDFAAYLIQAQSIVRGTERDAVAHMAYSVQHSTNYPVPSAAPWGFAALLAPWSQACGSVNVVCLKSINLPLFALFLLAFFAFLRARLPLADSALLVSIFAFSPVLLAFEDNILSDIAFLFFSTCAIAAIDLVFLRRAKFNGSWDGNVLIGALIAAAFFVRTNGILLLGAVAVAQLLLFRRRPSGERPRAVALVPYAVFVVLAAIVLVGLPGGEGGSLAALNATSLHTIWEHLASYVVMPSVFFWTLPFYELLYGALIPFFIAGVLLRWKADLHVVTYAGLTLFLFVLWPFDQGLRYLFPLLPFFVYFTYCGMLAAGFRLGQRQAASAVQASAWQAVDRRVVRAGWVVIAAAFAFTSARAASNNMANGRVPEHGGPFDSSSSRMFETIRGTTAPKDVVIFDHPRAMHLLTGRDAILIDRCDLLDRGTVLVLRKRGGAVAQVAPERIATCNPQISLTQTFENDDYLVFRVARLGTSAESYRP